MSKYTNYNKIFNTVEYYFIYVIVIILVIFILFTIYLNYFTKFTKVITINNSDYYKSGKNGLNLVNDLDGNVYTIKNSIYQLFFTGPELYSSLKNGKKYQIHGYGFRIPILGMYPNIISANEIIS